MEAAAFKTNLNPTEAAARTRALLVQFGLVECCDVMIGHPEGKKGLSGGQKKRLSVALELMGQPSLLFLDEPTSGLDAVAAAGLVRDLKKLADTGVTVVATIHQPSTTTFLTFDRLLLLASGKPCYAGPVSETQPLAFLKEAGHVSPPLCNPADLLMEVLSSAPDVIDKLNALCVAKAEWQAPRALARLQVGGPAFPSSFCQQFRTLILRNVRVNAREPALIRARVVSHVLVGVIMGGMYFDLDRSQAGANDRIALFLFSMIFLMLSATLPTIITVLPELAVTRKETRNNWYGLFAYYVAKVVSDTPLLVIPPLLYMATMGPMSGLVDSASRFGALYLASVIQVSVAHAWAMVISCGAPSLPVAVFLAPISIMPMILFAGFFKNVADLSWAFRWISYIDHESYCWEVFAIGTFHNLTLDAPLTGAYVLQDRLAISDPSMGRFWRSFAILVIFTVVWRLSAFAALKRRIG